MDMNHGYFKNHDDPGTLNGSFEHGYFKNKVQFDEGRYLEDQTKHNRKDPNRAQSNWIQMEKKSSPLHYSA